MFCSILIFIINFLIKNSHEKLSLSNIVEDEFQPALDGRVCAFGDINKDRYTDLIVLRNKQLVILLQTEQGTFLKQDPRIISLDDNLEKIFCSVGDFNGDAVLDILIKQKKDKIIESTIYLGRLQQFDKIAINVTFHTQPIVIDINGDGMSDIVGFYGHLGKKLYCLAGGREKFTNCSDNFINYQEKILHESFSPIFADFDSDLRAELVLGYKNESNLQLDIWKLVDKNYKWELETELSLPNSSELQYFAGPVVADFNGDAFLDILIPVCRESACLHVSHVVIYTKKTWYQVQIDLKDSELIVDQETKTVFRVGDFSLDGYPDLIATVKSNGKVTPKIIENIENTDNSGYSRIFELKTAPQLVMPAELSRGQILMSSFFDLKEDGNLDILVEYINQDNNSQKTKHDFIKCDDKGDTTFLKVQIFSNVCTNDCPDSQKKSDIGSGIIWHGACVSFNMSDSWGGSRVSLQCQLPQTSHRELLSSFVLFGLGRSPNFIDSVNMGSPRYTKNVENYRKTLTQIVPNSRIIVVPPDGNGTHWDSRLYLTPSRSFESVIVLTVVCFVLLILIVLLHFRERQQDRKERQAQTHRFHFDAM